MGAYSQHLNFFPDESYSLQLKQADCAECRLAGPGDDGIEALP